MPFFPCCYNTGADSSPGRRIRLIILAASIILTLSACSKEKKVEAPSAPPSVPVIDATLKDAPVVFEKIAQTQSSHLVNIQARVSGFLEKRMYTEGAMVKKGTVLFQLDQKPFQVQVDQTAAVVTKHEASLKAARQNLERIIPLAKANAVSKKDLDDATSRVDSESAQLDQAKAQLESAKLNLSYTTITSPVTGITAAAMQTEGTYINQQNSLLTTVSVISPIWVNFSMSENEMLKYRKELATGKFISPGGGRYTVEVVLADGSIFPHTGHITFASPSYNAQTGTFLIRASIDNPDGALLPNQFVQVRMKGALRPMALLLPQRAVQQGPKGHFVWVLGKDDKVEERPVTVGEWQGDDWLINEGIRAGERVVADPGPGLSPGAKVSPKPYEPAGGKPGTAAPPKTR